MQCTFTSTLQTCSKLCVANCYAAHAIHIDHTTHSCLPHNVLHFSSFVYYLIVQLEDVR